MMIFELDKLRPAEHPRGDLIALPRRKEEAPRFGNRGFSYTFVDDEADGGEIIEFPKQLRLVDQPIGFSPPEAPDSGHLLDEIRRLNAELNTVGNALTKATTSQEKDTRHYELQQRFLEAQIGRVRKLLRMYRDRDLRRMKLCNDLGELRWWQWRQRHRLVRELARL